MTVQGQRRLNSESVRVSETSLHTSVAARKINRVGLLKVGVRLEENEKTKLTARDSITH